MNKKQLIALVLVPSLAAVLVGCEQAPVSVQKDTPVQTSPVKVEDESGLALEVLGVANATVESANVIGRYVGVPLYSSLPLKLVPLQDLPADLDKRSIGYFKPHPSGVEGQYTSSARTEATVASYEPKGALDALRGKMGAVESVGVLAWEEFRNTSGHCYLLFPENTQVTNTVDINAEGYLFHVGTSYDQATSHYNYTFSPTKTLTDEVIGTGNLRRVLSIDLSVRVTDLGGKPISGLKTGNFTVSGSTWRSGKSTETETGVYLIRGHVFTSMTPSSNQSETLNVGVHNGGATVTIPVSK